MPYKQDVIGSSPIVPTKTKKVPKIGTFFVLGTVGENLCSSPLAEDGEKRDKEKGSKYFRAIEN